MNFISHKHRHWNNLLLTEKHKIKINRKGERYQVFMYFDNSHINFYTEKGDCYAFDKHTFCHVSHNLMHFYNPFGRGVCQFQNGSFKILEKPSDTLFPHEPVVKYHKFCHVSSPSGSFDLVTHINIFYHNLFDPKGNIKTYKLCIKNSGQFFITLNGDWWDNQFVALGHAGNKSANTLHRLVVSNRGMNGMEDLQMSGRLVRYLDRDKVLLVGTDFAECLNILNLSKLWKVNFDGEPKELLPINGNSAVIMTDEGIVLIKDGVGRTLEFPEYGKPLAMCLSEDKLVASLMTEQGILEIDTE